MAPFRKSAEKSRKHPVAHDNRLAGLVRQKNALLRDYVDLNRKDPEKGLQCILEIIEWAEENDQIGLKARAMIYATDACKFLGREDEMRRYMAEVENLVDMLGSLSEKEWILSSLGACYVRFDEWKTGLGLMQQSLEIANALELPERKRAGTYQSMAIAFFKAGAYEEALECSLRAYSLFDADTSVFARAQGLINIGTMYGSLLDYSKAREYYQQALELCSDGSYDEGPVVCNLNIGDCLLQQQQPADALHHLDVALSGARVLGERSYIVEILCMMGNCHSQLGDTGRALEICDEALMIADDAGDEVQYATALRVKGEVLLKVGELEGAGQAFLQSLELGRKYELPAHDLEVHKSLADLYERIGDFRQCCEHRRKTLDIHQSIAGVERQKAVGAIELRYAMLAEQQERDILRLRAEKAERQSEAMTRELNSSVLMLTQRSEALRSLRKIIEPYITTGKGELRKLALDIRKSIEGASHAEEEWKQLEAQFERVHQDFIGTLKGRCPELTATELRICVLIRLNLSSKQIADTLSLSPLTIKTHRANIRRKLYLDGQSNLTGFLMAT